MMEFAKVLKSSLPVITKFTKASVIPLNARVVADSICLPTCSASSATERRPLAKPASGSDSSLTRKVKRDAPSAACRAASSIFLRASASFSLPGAASANSRACRASADNWRPLSWRAVASCCNDFSSLIAPVSRKVLICSSTARSSPSPRAACSCRSFIDSPGNRIWRSKFDC